jgi:hypothetical protein
MASAPKPKKSALSNVPEGADKNTQKFLEEMRNELIRVSGMAAAALAGGTQKVAGGGLTIVQEVAAQTGLGEGNLAASGWWNIPVGANGENLQLRWGRFTVNNGASKQIDFAQPFTNACFVVIAGGTNVVAGNAQDNAIDVLTTTNPSTTSFNVTTARDGTSNGMYIAIGF